MVVKKIILYNNITIKEIKLGVTCPSISLTINHHFKYQQRNAIRNKTIIYKLFKKILVLQTGLQIFQAIKFNRKYKLNMLGCHWHSSRWIYIKFCYIKGYFGCWFIT